MVQTKRYFLPGETYYLSLQGQEGCLCFFDDACYKQYMARLDNCLGVYQVKLHAFALLPKQIQLLITPSTPTGISNLMHTVGRAYIQYFNNRFERNGSIWKHSFDICPIPDEWYVLECQKYIELAPIWAKLVNSPGQWQWSSYCTNAFGGHGGRVNMHEQYKKLDTISSGRYQQYRDFFAVPFSATQLKIVQHRLSYGYPRGLRRKNTKSIRVVKKITKSPSQVIQGTGIGV